MGKTGMKSGKGAGRRRSGFNPAIAFRQHQDVAVDSLARLWRERAASLMTWLVIGIALALPICLLVLVHNVQRLGGGVEQVARLSLFLQPGLPALEAETLAVALRDRDE